MSLVLLPLMIALGICLVPIWLLPRRNLRASECFIASQPATPPDVIRNASVAYPLRIAAFGPFFAWGASGDLWPAIIAAACLGSGVYLIYALRRPLFAFLDSALDGNTSMTVPAFIARCHGDDGRVRLLTAGLTLVALAGLIAAEALATATLAAPVMMESARAVDLVAGGMLILTALYAIFAGNSGVMHSVQLQAGMIYLALFGATALLLYFLVSDVTTMPPHGSFAVMFIAAAGVLILFYRRFKYVDNTPIGRANGPDAADAARLSSRLSPRLSPRLSWGSRLLRWLEKALDTFISVFVILALVLTVMEFSFFGFPVMARDGIVALQSGAGISGTALLTVVIVSLLYPLVDVATWQRLAALAKGTGSRPDLRSATVARIFKSLAAEVMLLLLLMCMFGAIAATAAETPVDRNALQMFIRQLSMDDSLPATLAISFVLVGLFAMALSATSSMLSASLWVWRYDMLPALWPALAPEQIKPGDEAIARRRAILLGCGFCLAAVLLVSAADTLLGFSFTAGTFLAVLFACWCAQLSSVSLLLAPIGLGGIGMGAVSPSWALVIVGVAAASGIATVMVYLATGAEPWLWAAVPACLGTGLALFAVARLCRPRPAGG
ncbi:MAG TPA: hypothetical protein VH678_23915 [Xanthobacteraceae bacterium]|jgi:hypothetical protein